MIVTFNGHTHFFKNNIFSKEGMGYFQYVLQIYLTLTALQIYFKAVHKVQVETSILCFMWVLTWETRHANKIKLRC